MEKKRLYEESEEEDSEQEIYNNKLNKKICTEGSKKNLQQFENSEKSIENSENEEESYDNNDSQTENQDLYDNLQENLGQDTIFNQKQQSQQEEKKDFNLQNSLKIDQTETQQRHRQYLLKSVQDQQQQNDDIFSKLLFSSTQQQVGNSNKNIEDDNDINLLLHQDDSQSETEETITPQDVQNNKEQIEKIEEFLKQRSAKLLKCPNKNETKITEYTLFTLKCSKNHIWDSNMKILLGYWCPRCIEPFQKIKQYVKKLNGKLISKCLMDEMEFECSKKHRFTLQLKNYFDNWCTACYDEILDSLKMPSDNEYFQHIKESSQRQATEFIKKYPNQFNFQNDAEKIQTVIYINDIPERMLMTYLSQLDKEELKKQKSKIQRNIHPDVNRHPYARQAFAKFQSLLEKI